ncbi:hypothetical protein [Spongiivirga citrea]|uniref:Uncharacterized protein n=1 Tax=Spongiivirga citrea TaxID=1481457 RepID=A0A6M0CM46_9FLAO|nr:hypothetical protein [Spongiivirga citrea]NER19016.1 hypothetical protein [Spongiivirga citrea]
MKSFAYYKSGFKIVVLLFFLSAFCFHSRAQEIANIVENKKPYKVLLSKQDSDFKNEVVEELELNFDDVNFKVTELSALKDLNVNNWDAIVILHSWEFLNPPRSVKRFIRANTSIKNKIIVLTTSSDGDSKMDEVDAITGESVLVDAYEYAYLITQRLNKVFARAN